MVRIVTLTIMMLLVAAFAAGDEPPAVEREPLAFDVLQFHLEGDLLLPQDARDCPAVVVVWGAGPTDRERTIASPVVRRILDAGCAVYVHDKPGSGGSTGDFLPGRLFHERAAITAAALDTLAAHPRLDPRRLGLYGSSQAAYVVPLVLDAGARASFLIAWSFPMENSIEQSAYLVENMVRCAGRGEEAAAEAGERYRRRAMAPDYAAYREAAAWLDSLPEIREELGWGGVVGREEFSPLVPDAESFLDPGVVMPALAMPALVIYGSNDRNIDPVQGADRFRALLRSGPEGHQELLVIEGADHNMRLTPDGCVQHQLRRYADVPDSGMCDAFLAAIGDWLRGLPRPTR